MPSTKTEKKIKRQVKSDSEEEVCEPVREDDKQDDKFETNEPSSEVGEKKIKSIIDFDSEEAQKYANKTIKEASIIEILKVLIVRGKDEHNPALWRGSERLLQQLNGERQRHPPRGNQPFRGNQSFRGNQPFSGNQQFHGNAPSVPHDNFERGSYRPRGQFYQQEQPHIQQQDGEREQPHYGYRSGYKLRENIR